MLLSVLINDPMKDDLHRAARMPEVEVAEPF